MANRYAVANGNWSSLATWDGGVSLPGVGDVVRPNTYTVTIDQNVTVGTLINNASSPAVAGGSFVVSASGFTITANLTMAGNALLTFSHSGTLSIVGNITTALVVQVSSSGCILITSTGTLTVTGNVSTSTNFQTHSAIRSTTNCTVNITGNVSGAGTTSSLYINYGVFLSGAATLSITGSATNADWGYAVSALNASSVVTITGNVACSSVNTECVAFGGSLLMNGTVSTAGYAALFGNDVGTATLAGSVIATTGTAGQFWANRLRVLITPSASQSMGMLTSSFASRSLYTGGISVGHPATTDVRSGTAFGASSEYTGTLAVPSPTLVAIGVSTDNTVGSYAPTGGLDAAGVRTAIGLATANLDTQLSGIQSDTNDIQTRLPAALESGRIAAVLDSAAINAVADQVWDEATSGHTTAGTYGGRIVRATNTNVEVQITGSNHIAADVHEFQAGVITAGDFAANSITASALATDAVTEIQSGLATAAALATESTKITAIETFATRVTTGLVADGAVYQFTANMLELAPSSGGGAGDASQATLLEVKAKTDLIGTTSGISSLLAASVLTPGTITEFPDTLTIGDSYTTANGRSIQIPIVDTDGNQISSTGSLNFADATATFVIKRAKETDSTRIITGTAAFTDPVGTGTSGAPYAVVQLISSETAKGLIGYKYSGVLTFTWPYVGTGTDPEVMSFETDTLNFDN